MLNTKTISSINTKQEGFTFIELIIVIIILTILSASVLPKFFTSQGFEEVAYRNEVIAKLRAIQLRAMQQTNNQCSKIVVNTVRLGLMATDNSTADNCHPSNFQCQALASNNTCTTSVFVESDHQVILAGENSFYFDSMGRPVDCNSPCLITITGEDSLIVAIEEEGYIHAL